MTKINRTALASFFFLAMFAFGPLAAIATADPPIGAGGKKFGYGRYQPISDTVVLKIPGTPGFWAPRSRDNHNNVPNWDAAVDRDRLGQYPDGTACQLMLSGHGNEGGVGSQD